MNLLLVFCFIIGSRAQILTDFNEKVNNFGIELMYFTHNEINNTLISPFGVWSVLTGLSTGATNLSKAWLIEVLHLPNNDVRIRDGFTYLTQIVLKNTMVQSKNNLYYHMNITISNQFENTLTDHFDILPVKLDFRESYSAAQVANIIISDAGIITNTLLNSSNFMNAKVILTSVIKFRSLLESPFSKDRTSIRRFYVSPNEVEDVNMMQQTGRFVYTYIDDIRSELIELPYAKNNISMIVILPNRNVSLDKLYERIKRISIENVIRKLEIEEKKIVSVSIPRFKIISNLILNSPLTEMGLDIFTPYTTFNGTTKGFYISKLVHKVDVEVIESNMNSRSSSQLNPAKIFVADRPFVYLFVEKTTKTCIIGGILTKPTPF